MKISNSNNKNKTSNNDDKNSTNGCFLEGTGCRVLAGDFIWLTPGRMLLGMLGLRQVEQTVRGSSSALGFLHLSP